MSLLSSYHFCYFVMSNLVVVRMTQAAKYTTSFVTERAKHISL